MLTSCAITDISWERIHLTLTASVSPPPEPGHDLEFMIVDQERVFPVDTERVDSGSYRLRINITNFRLRSQVPDGSWRLVPFLDGEPNLPATFDLSELHRLDDASRTFIYNNNRVSYMIVFDISEDDVRPDLLMRTYQMFRNPKPSATAVKPPLARRVVARALPRARRVKAANQVYKVARLTKKRGRTRILFASEMRPGLDGNLLRIHDRLIERGLDTEYDLQYSFRLPHTGTKKSFLRLLYLLATSDVVLVDDYFGIFETLQLDPATKIIQAWHAGSGFKAIGYSRFGKYGSPRLQNAHRKYTYAITGAKHLVPVYAEAFGIEESAIIPTGLPRIDTFLDPARTEQVKADFYRDYPALTGKRILLFAPTFRGRGNTTAYYDYSRIDFAKLYEACGEDSVILFRMHHFVREPVPIPSEYADRLIDLRAYPDTNDLLHLTDVLITDYSSVIYEFALLDRPMLFFAYDKDVYAATRGFHRDFDATAPGKVCESIDDLVKAIQEHDFDTWKIAAFRRENFDVIDTAAADRVIDWLILGDPHTSELAGSEAAVRDPATGDTAMGNAELSDQDQA